MKGKIIDSSEDDQILMSIRNGTLELGKPIGCKLDDNLRFKKGTFNVILGHSNVGKTYWVLWYMLANAMQNGKRFLIFSSENAIYGLKRNLMQLLSQKKLPDMTEQEFYMYKLQIDGWFKFIDTDHLYSYKDLIKIFEANLSEFDACLIDPYNSLVRAEGMGGNSHEIDYQVASEFRIFCRVHGKTMFVNAHASTEALRKVYHKDHELAGYPIPPNASDIEGGGKWVNRADDFIVIHRLTQHPQHWMITEVHIKKVKETETGGTPTFMDEPIKFRLWDGCKFLCKNNHGEEIDVFTQVEVDTGLSDLPMNEDFENNGDNPF